MSDNSDDGAVLFAAIVDEKIIFGLAFADSFLDLQHRLESFEKRVGNTKIKAIYPYALGKDKKRIPRYVIASRISRESIEDMLFEL